MDDDRTLMWAATHLDDEAFDEFTKDYPSMTLDEFKAKYFPEDDDA